MIKFVKIGIAVILIGGGIFGLHTWMHGSPCDPQSSESQLTPLHHQGILGVQHPPSQSNLLWVFVGPAWHELPEDEKRAIDRVVRCAAQTIDETGQPTWQAAYYDQATGKLAGLTSRKWGFRLKDQESHFAQDFPTP